MGSDQRREKNKSLESFAKNYAKSILKTSAASLIFLLSSCSSDPKDPVTSTIAPVVVAKKLDLTSLGFQLTETGVNQMPSASEDERQIVFISSNRRSHKQGQVYIYDLNNLTERRITFQDGDCRDPILLKDGKHLLYASNTDELKENPLLFEKPSENSKAEAAAQAMELYRSDLSGADIERLSLRKGFDGEVWQRPDRPTSIIFSSKENNRMQPWQMNLQQSIKVPLMQKKEVSIYSLRPSPATKKWAWIERTDETASQVMSSTGALPGKKETKLSLPAGDYRDLNWINEDKIIFSAKITMNPEKPAKFYQIYSYDLGKNCLEKIFESASNLRSPQFLRNHQALLFASDLSGDFQIYNKALPGEGQCL